MNESVFLMVRRERTGVSGWLPGESGVSGEFHY